MRTLTVVLAAVALLAAPLAAQDPGARRQELQQQVMMRFMENLRRQAGLTDQQVERFQEVTRRSFEARNQLQQRERQLWVALEGQMRPGVAANADSVAKLLDGLTQIHVERADQARQDQAAFAEFLTPVQRAQVTMGFRRLQNLIDQQLRERMGPPGRRRMPPPQL